jgi:hypothetical protein
VQAKCEPEYDARIDQHTLSDAGRFSGRDLAENRKGRLSPAQARMLVRKEAGKLLGSAIGFIVTVQLGKGLADDWATGWGTGLFMTVALVIFLLIGVGFGFSAIGLVRDVFGGVKTATGPVKLGLQQLPGTSPTEAMVESLLITEPILVSPRSGTIIHRVEVAGIDFEISSALYEALRVYDGPMHFYYLPRINKLLSLEPERAHTR